MTPTTFHCARPWASLPFSILCSLTIAAWLLLPLEVNAQAGKDGEKVVGSMETVILNTYGVLAADVSAGATQISVTDSTDLAEGATDAFLSTELSAGDLLFIIQMQGASINSSNTASYGNVLDLAGAGLYEFAHVQSVDGNTILLSRALTHSYSAAGRTQVVRVPQYTSLTVQADIMDIGVITVPAWDQDVNGYRRGGVMVLSVQGTFLLDGNLTVSGLGFRGGNIDEESFATGVNSFVSEDPAVGGEKGESIAGYQDDYDAFGGRYGRGAPANGGGGGNSHNAGGGGGANGNSGQDWNGQGVMDTEDDHEDFWALDPYVTSQDPAMLTTSSGGGRGGYSYAEAALDALVVEPGDSTWGGDHRRQVGGWGGRAMTNGVSGASARLFMGGGGGAGDGNVEIGDPQQDAQAGEGGRGGGIIFVLAQSLTGQGHIFAHGFNGGSSHVSSSECDGTDDGDGAGGGGAGGTIVVMADAALTGIDVSAQGGPGGVQTALAGCNQFESYGPGGGGSGGFVLLPPDSADASSGIIGYEGGTTNSLSLNEWPSNGATSGASGEFSLTSPRCSEWTNCPFDLEAAVDIVAPENNAVSSNHAPAISGTADAAASLTVTVTGPKDFAQTLTDTADADGLWSVVLATGVVLGEDGEYVITATALDALGNQAQDVHTYTLDTVAPDLVIEAPLPGENVQTTVPVVRGASSADVVQVSVEIVAAGGNTVAGPANATLTDGQWSYTVSPPLACDEYTANVVATDAAGLTAEKTVTFEACPKGPLVIDTNGDGIPDAPDSDGDGIADGLDTRRGGATGGAGCSLAQHSTGNSLLYGWVLALCLGFAIRRRARKRDGTGKTMNRTQINPMQMFFGVLLVVLVASASLAQAQQNIMLDQFRPAETTEDGFALSRAIDRGHNKFGVQLTGDYANDPLVYEADLGDADSESTKLVEHQVFATLAVSYGLWNRLVLYAGLPVNVWTDGQDFGTFQPPEQNSLGDAWAGFRVRLVGERRDLFGLGFQFTGTFPTADAATNQTTFSGEPGFTLLPKLLLEVRPLPIRITANVGARFRTEETNVPSLQTSHELTYGLGLGFELAKETLELIAEGYGSTTFENFGDRQTTPLEVLGGFKWFAGGGFAVGAAAGPGLARGYGSPDVRGVLQVGWSAPVDKKARDWSIHLSTEPQPGDEDGDGILDENDACPTQPEDEDGFEDADGCPESDNDKDGVLDVDDKCPGQPEDIDSFEDADGCPENDNDQDGIFDAQDGAPNDPEDKDGFEDSDGVPDRDNDKDGVLDVDDKCPMTPGKAEDEGCPRTTRVEGNQIRILERIEFESGKAKLRKESYLILEDVSVVMQTMPQIKKVRVEGHTDSQGSDTFNLKLSQQRAEAVRSWLIDHGVEAERLEAQGFGETEPLEDNKTKEGRQANRRVQFTILESDVGGGSASQAESSDGLGL